MGQAVLIAAVVAGTAATVHSQRQATGAQEVELELAKRQEQRGAADREVQRKRRLVAILGSQRAAAAASGFAMSGSVANISITDAKRAAEDSRVDSLNSRLRIDSLSRRKRSIRRAGNAQTATTILGAVERSAERGDFE